MKAKEDDVKKLQSVSATLLSKGLKATEWFQSVNCMVSLGTWTSSTVNTNMMQCNNLVFSGIQDEIDGIAKL